MTGHWKETHLPTMLSRYKLQDIFNADKFGLFLQALPNKTLELKAEKCTGGKYNKVRLTGITVASAAGEKLPILAIGKAKNPIFLKNMRSLPCMCKTQKKLDELTDIHRLDQTVGSKIPSSELKINISCR